MEKASLSLSRISNSTPMAEQRSYRGIEYRHLVAASLFTGHPLDEWMLLYASDRSVNPAKFLKMGVKSLFKISSGKIAFWLYFST